MNKISQPQNSLTLKGSIKLWLLKNISPIIKVTYQIPKTQDVCKAIIKDIVF